MMANNLHLSILRKGKRAWNEWRKGDYKTPDFRGENLSNMDLQGFNLGGANFQAANLSGTNLSYANLVSAEMNNANLRESNLVSAEMINVSLYESDLTGADLSGALLTEAHCSRAIFTEAILVGTSLISTSFSGACLSKARFENVRLWENSFDTANMTGASMVGMDFGSVNITRANFSEANITGARFQWARANGANFTDACADKADFSMTSLADVDFTNASLCNALFDRSLFLKTCFKEAKLTKAIFSNVDLRQCQGLQFRKESGPAIISVDTVYRSGGMEVEALLRSCGIPEGFIQYSNSLIEAEQGLQFYSCFISYSSADVEFAEKLYRRMLQDHIQVWFAPQNIKGGQKLHEQIEEAIHVYDKLLILLSPASLKSEWVMTELRKARKAERKTHARKLFPVRIVDFDTIKQWECFDSDAGQDLAVEVRQYYIPDFSNWKDEDRFEAEFARLLADLRANAKLRA